MTPRHVAQVYYDVSMLCNEPLIVVQAGIFGGNNAYHAFITRLFDDVLSDLCISTSEGMA